MNKNNSAMQTETSATHTIMVSGNDLLSVWPLGRDLPLQWREGDFRGSLDDCQRYIAAAWAGETSSNESRSAPVPFRSLRLAFS